ncbi:hypothetical protein HOG21_01075 [bacterium]|nr:hypothetical protein [bacterium]
MTVSSDFFQIFLLFVTFKFKTTSSLGLYSHLFAFISIKVFLSVLSTTISVYQTLYSGIFSLFVSTTNTQIYAFGRKVSSTINSLKKVFQTISIYSCFNTHCFSIVQSIFHFEKGSLTKTLAFSHNL